jgi:hypothetical protein
MTLALLPINFATNARVNVNDSVVPVVASILLLVARNFVSHSKRLNWIGAGNACK